MANRRIDAVIGLGSNLGRREHTVALALGGLERIGDVVAVSPMYETRAVGPPQPDYINAAARLRTDLRPPELLEAILALEQSFGRVRGERWGPRTIDLDILWIDGVVCYSPTLVVPHPELTRRAFALAPLLDVAPAAVDPDGVPYRQHWEQLSSTGIRKL